MIIDSRTIEADNTIRADVCIVGAGPAGIALAREWSGSGFRVAVLESGGLEPDEATLALSKGESVGLPYDRLDDARFRAFGGASNTWALDIGYGGLGARLRAMDPIDFEQREWVPHSGWPFDRAHLEPYYERAHRFFKVGPADYDVAFWEDPLERPRLPFKGNRVESTVFQFARSDVLLDHHRNELFHSDNVTVYLYASVTRFHTDESGQRVDRARVACLAGGDFVLMPFDAGLQRVRVATLPESRFWVEAKQFVVAAGGTENARLLLVSNDVHKNGLGNSHDLVGRYFMEHQHMWSGRFIPATPEIAARTKLYGIHYVNDVPVMAKLALSEEVLRRERLLNYCVSILPIDRPAIPEGVHSLFRLKRALEERKAPRRLGRHVRNIVTGFGDIASKGYAKATGRPRDKLPTERIFRLDNMAEQAPNPDSRVTLSGQRDALGMPRVRLEWRVMAEDMLSMARSQEIIDEELRRAGLGRLQIDLDSDTPPPGLKGGWHHMGTTRMHLDPKQGVVDENCRVHGLANLYVTGSSVFPTAGYANPTLTIAALAIRLADHLPTQLSERVEISARATS